MPGVIRVGPADEPLAALVEDGLPLVARPYDAWASALGVSGEYVRVTLERWLREGTLRRFGAIVRHHEAGFAHNAMTLTCSLKAGGSSFAASLDCVIVGNKVNIDTSLNPTDRTATSTTSVCHKS